MLWYRINSVINSVASVWNIWVGALWGNDQSVAGVGNIWAEWWEVSHA